MFKIGYFYWEVYQIIRWDMLKYGVFLNNVLNIVYISRVNFYNFSLY